MGFGFGRQIVDAVSKVVPAVQAASPGTKVANAVKTAVAPKPVAQTSAPAQMGGPAKAQMGGPAKKQVSAPAPKVPPKRFGKFSAGGSTGSASKRADGIAQKGKTKGRMI